ncbi:carbohydrate ABC transporter permease [Paenibacillus protaetiae]|uniref:Carbohydrate ABC transporter permease n=1 Tax=Paenibacillus protaetiae TaxID=2509456 RepID=A0A4P6EWI5_9BACL|nr:carbohydrate ABC transporter permease [Paenibacillus protaetiae]QAY66975.1 carbohydrate ABC transporter permease [Paenibacillus protaetiae]
MKKSLGARLFDVFNITLMLFICVTIVFPFVQQAVISISPPDESSEIGLHLYTLKPTFDSFKQIFATGSIWDAYYWTILRTVLGTILTVVVSAMLAYPLSKRYLLARKVWMGLIVFTMFFGGGLIPTYLLVKDLHMLNTVWALIIPGLCSAYNIVIIRNFFTSLPIEVEESAYMDGANDVTVFFKIVLPLSAPIIATVTLWSLVGQWNAWFDAMIYISNGEIKVLQILLRDVLNNAQDAALANIRGVENVDMSGQRYTAESVKAAILLVTTIPIIMVYPFLQKYFVKGIMIGAVKG